MRYCILFFLFFCQSSIHAQIYADGKTKDSSGFEFKVKIIPLSYKKLLLGCNIGEKQYIADSAIVNQKGEAIFKSKFAFPQGIYMLLNDKFEKLFNIIIDSNQHFSLNIDLSNPQQPKYVFINSPENNIVVEYNQLQKEYFTEFRTTKELLINANDADDIVKYKLALDTIDKKIKALRTNTIKNNPNSFFSKVLVAMYEPVLPDSLKVQKNRNDTIRARQYVRDHFWDGVEFWDTRLIYTPFFMDKVKKYFIEVAGYKTKEITKDIDYMLSYASGSDLMTQMLLNNFIQGSLSHMYKWNDSVYVHLFEKYIGPKNYSWISAKEREKLSEKAYYMMGKMIGSGAPDIELNNLDSVKSTLYNLKSKYTILAFWDPKCHHCRETLPQMDSMYKKMWKQKGVKVFSVATQSDGTIQDWYDYINEHHLQAWENVYSSSADEQQSMQLGKPSVTQKYDVWYFPSFFVLDSEKRFVAKKLNYQQMVDFLKTYLK